MKERRKGATGKIDAKSARSVCFCKRHKGLFKKAKELCELHPTISVSAIAFSPADNPVTFGDPLLFSSSFNKSDTIDSLQGMDISSLSKAQLESHLSSLQHFRSLLLSKCNEKVPGLTTNSNSIGIGVEESNIQGSEFSPVQSSEILDEEDEIGVMVRGFFSDGDTDCCLDGMIF